MKIIFNKKNGKSKELLYQMLFRIFLCNLVMVLWYVKYILQIWRYNLLSKAILIIFLLSKIHLMAFTRILLGKCLNLSLMEKMMPKESGKYWKIRSCSLRNKKGRKKMIIWWGRFICIFILVLLERNLYGFIMVMVDRKLSKKRLEYYKI